ncbi:hypothetical protein [Treponema sp.]|uniref:hypothetical protein n=1 Tax=Treponema sp. TaxID=166 RepID=UPI00298EB69D|nr:hypothetical protein [Treponema sp.]MCQ2241539.1 hypothetical protein [Treponema sp.]
MSFRKVTSAIFISAFIFSAANALDKIPFTITSSDGKQVTIDIPADLAPLVEQNKTQIEKALKENGITEDKIKGAGDVAKSYEAQIDQIYEDYKKRYPQLTSPYADTIGQLNNFCDQLVDVIPNTQGFQNIYADAWIGKLIPSAHFGAGVNVGASSIDVSSLKKTAEALDINVGDIPDTLAFPTISADLRIGGIILPFDVGITAMKFDSSTVSAIENAIDPMNFDYYVIGGDVRYALLKGGMLKPKVSLGAGYYYTSGSVGVRNDKASASLDFSSQAYLLEAQASIKLLFLIPFVGTKLIYSKTDINWAVDAKWDQFIDSNASEFGNLIDQGILPSHFSGNSSGSSFHPQIFGGFGLDLFIMTATATVGYDLKSKIISGAISTRISW